jgi:hypothetical protein
VQLLKQVLSIGQEDVCPAKPGQKTDSEAERRGAVLAV